MILPTSSLIILAILAINYTAGSEPLPPPDGVAYARHSLTRLESSIFEGEWQENGKNPTIAIQFDETERKYRMTITGTPTAFRAPIYFTRHKRSIYLSLSPHEASELDGSSEWVRAQRPCFGMFHLAPISPGVVEVRHISPELTIRANRWIKPPPRPDAKCPVQFLFGMNMADQERLRIIDEPADRFPPLMYRRITPNGPSLYPA